ncbi:MAG TPA: holo-ACP synthase, partial [Alphaproteobacteria bacterium]|nr:holo-ACP synthase [Alphaproteobacteria bacterium]
MIYGIGSDLLKVSRMTSLLKNHQERFIEKLLTPHEKVYLSKKSELDKELAKFYAAKEAILKALGTGMIEGFRWKDMEIFRLPSGKPSFRLFGGCLSILGGNQDEYDFHLSLSDEENIVV